MKLNEMEEVGVISKVNEPREWINNIVVVEKGEKIRLCMDPKYLNESLKDFRYPILSLNELRQDLKNAKYFSVLDLKDGFWHIDLDEDSPLHLVFISSIVYLLELKLHLKFFKNTCQTHSVILKVSSFISMI